MRAFKHHENAFVRTIRDISFKIFGGFKKKRDVQDLLYQLAVRAIASNRYKDVCELNMLAATCYNRKFFLEYKNRLANHLIHRAEWEYNGVMEKEESEEKEKNED